MRTTPIQSISDRVELSYWRLREIVDVLAQEVEDARMILDYADATKDNLGHLSYILERAEKAHDDAARALDSTQALAYELSLIDEVPAA